jgi:hypothetical protein
MLQTSDAVEWMHQHANLVKPYLSLDGPNPTAAWGLFERAPAEMLEPFARELAHAATGRLKKLRNQLRPLARIAGYDLLNDPLRDRARVGNAGERLEAMRILREVVPPELVDELAAWATEYLSGDRSKAVRAEVEALRQSPMSIPAVAASIEVEVTVPLELAVMIRPFHESWLRTGSRAHPSSVEVLALLASGGATDLVRQLEPAHIVRILCSVPSSTVVDRENLRKFVEGVPEFPTLAQVETVVRHDFPYQAFSAVLRCVGRVSAQPWIDRYWTREEIVNWIVPNLAQIGDHVRDPKLARSIPQLYEFLVPLENSLPQDFRESLFDAAIDSPKRFRIVRQEAYRDRIVERVIPYLTAPKAAARLSAAEWLERLGDPACSDAVVQAIDAEKSVPVRAVLSRLVEQFAVRTSQSMHALDAEACKARGSRWATPKTIDWLDFKELPALRDIHGSPVDPGTAEWVVANSVKTNSVRPAPVLLDFVKCVAPGDAHLWGEFLLQEWIAEDQRTPSIEEARALAVDKREIRGIAHTIYRDMDDLMVEILSKPVGTALSSKGLLAVVAASGTPRAGQMVAEFIDHWGTNLRKQQCIRLLEMLSWTDAASAVSTVIDVAQGHWLDSLQEQAIASARVIAERENWDEDTLQDRLAEKGELNSEGVLILDSAGRSFQATLGADLKLRLVDRATGDLSRSVPTEINKKPWLEVSQVGRQRLAKTRRAIRRSVERERDRLNHARASGRQFDGNHFVSAILGHPVLRHLAAEYTWRLAPDHDSSTFQVMPDRTLQTADGEPVDPRNQLVLCVDRQAASADPD